MIIAFFFIFLAGSFLLQLASSALRSLEQSHSEEQLEAGGWFSVYRSFQGLLFKKRELDVLFFSITSTRHILRYCLALTVAILFWATDFKWLWLIGGFLVSLIIGDFIPRMIATRYPTRSLQLSSPFATIYLFIASPVSFLLAKVFATPHEVPQEKEKIMEMIEKADVEESEKQLLSSVAGFRDLIVREVMTPRVDIFALPSDITLREAAKLFDEEGYSRAPVYKENIDQVIGMAMYKDIMGLGLEDEAALDRHVETLLKPIIFVPETSKVTHLFEQFRDKQTHLAIVVDEYGGTEGLVTIEDCLEEIVGEISDEYDEEEKLFTPEKAGSWIVDGRMSINDIEEQFGIEIPQEGDYDTIGGYAFHKAGEIPEPGLTIHHDDFDLEILESSERCIEKIKITSLESSEGQ